MTDKPEALRLADALETELFVWDDNTVDLSNEIAAELRQLHAENERLKAHIVGWTNRMECELIPMDESLEAQRDELLAALRYALWLIETLTPIEGDITRRARAAIAKAEGSQK